MHCKIFLAVAWFLFVITIGSCQSQENLALSYEQRIKKHHSEKNEEFRDPEKSPLPPEKIPGFQGLRYFPVDSAFKVKAKLVRNLNPAPFKMLTTTDRRPDYLKYGELFFTLDSQQFRLSVYQNLELVKKPGYEDFLFIPFYDETSVFETYGGGRYIDIRMPKGDTVMVDFNLAYNPYCAYNPRYSCPIPPKENHLNIHITAGEKNFK